MNKEILFCQYCDSDVNVQYHREKITNVINGESISIEIDVPYCSKCKKELSDLDMEDERYELLYNEYRKIKGLLLPIEIKEIREKYELSQRAFSRVLGFAESTINRYELGAIQDNSNNSLIKLSNNPENMKYLLDQNRNNLSESEQSKLQTKINQLLNKQEIDVISIEEKLNFLIEKSYKNDNKLANIDRKIEMINRKIINNNLESKTVDYLDNLDKVSQNKVNKQKKDYLLS